MKKSMWILFLSLPVILFSCEDVLDVEPAQSLDASTAVQDEEDLVFAMNGCYNAMQYSGYYGRNLVNLGDLASDNAYNGGTIKEYGQINNNMILADNGIVINYWQDVYIAINRVNNLLGIVENMKALDDEKALSYQAELRFLRALHYYNLVRSFGPVPLKLNATENLDDINTPLSTEEEIYDQIMLDLGFAEGNISQTSKLKATNAAVVALKAKVFLQLEEYEDAASAATELIENENLSLLDNYAELYTEEENSESIFEVSFIEQEKNRLAEYFFPSNLTGRYEVAPTQELIDSYEEGDARLEATIAYAGQKPYVNKYEQISLGSDNVYVFRLAEMYLIRAECYANLERNGAQAVSDLNTIRTRAGLDLTTAANYEELRLAVEEERRHEFAFEGHRWFDLVRTDRAIDVLSTVTSEDQYYFPIPLDETSTNEAID